MIPETPKSPFESFTLPAGYLAADGQLHREVRLAEMTGVEEDILASSMHVVAKMEGMIAGCLRAIGPVEARHEFPAMVRSLSIADRAFLIVAVRRVTSGKTYRFQATCPECKKVQTKEIDLSTLDVTAPPEPEKRLYQVKTPRGRVVEMRVMTGVEENKAIELRRKHRDQPATLSLLLRVVKIDGKDATFDSVRELPSSERQFLRDAFDKAEGGIETEVDAECQECRAEFKVEIDVTDRGFFFPSAT